MKRKTLAIPIRCVDYSNTSQVLSLFTREAGLVEGIAKGAHREKNAFQGPFDLAELREVVYVERKSPGLSIVAEAEVVDGLRGLRRSWHHYLGACLVLEVLRAVPVGGEPHRELFDLATGALRTLDSGSERMLSVTLLHFEVQALRVLGFLGPVDACVACGRHWPGGSRPAVFNPRAGGLLCRRCLGRETAPRQGLLPGAAVELLGALATSRRVEGVPRAEPSVLSRLHILVGQSCVLFLEYPLKMLKYSPNWS